jgi:hypothetical protein
MGGGNSPPYIINIMPVYTQNLPLDGSYKPVNSFGFLKTTSTTFSGSNATVNVPLFHITGTVLITGLYGVVTTVIGVNHTASSYRINDQTSQIYLTAVGGIDISGNAAGSMVVKKGVVATALSELTNVAGAILEPTTLETPLFSQVLVMKKTAAVTDIEYHYATTDTPTTGAMKHYVWFIPLTDDGDLTVI